MTKDEITEGNKLIAEFMKLEGFDDGRYGWLWKNPTNKNGSCFSLEYNSSWDWLMPVVHKCIADIKAMGFDKRGSWNPEHGYVSEIYVMRLDNPIEMVWEEVVKHIKRYKK